MIQQTKHFYQFGPFRMDAAERLLLREGEVIPPTPKAFDLLLTLVTHSGHMLEKEELMKQVWPDSLVEEANIGPSNFPRRGRLLSFHTTIVVQSYNMLNLRSKLRQKLFGYYFTNPGAKHYLRELAVLLDVDVANLSRELVRLENQGLFVSEMSGHQKYFRLNQKHPLYDELRRIVFKTIGVVGQLRKTFEEIGGLNEAYLYGSFARTKQDAASDIDVLLVGEPDVAELETAIRKLERQLHRQINYTLLSPGEMKVRRQKRDAFLEDIWRHKMINLLSSHEKAQTPAH